MYLSHVSIHLLVRWVFLVFMFQAEYLFLFFFFPVFLKSDLQFDKIVNFKRKQLTAKFSKTGKCQANFFRHAISQIRQTF